MLSRPVAWTARVVEVIHRIRSGNPRILDKDAKVYLFSSEDEEHEREPKQGNARKEKPLYLKDVNARYLLEEGPEFGEQPTRSSKYGRIAYDEQQKKGLHAFLDAQKDVIGDDDEDDFFHEKTKDEAGDQNEKDDEEEKQTKELAGEIFGKDEELDENDKLLKDYFLKRLYLEKENKSYLDDIQELSEEEDIEKQELSCL
jgi:protein KRI1